MTGSQGLLKSRWRWQYLLTVVGVTALSGFLLRSPGIGASSGWGAASILLQVVSAFLLYRAVRLMRLSWRIAFFSAVIYGTVLVRFYTAGGWVSFQHLVVLSVMLLFLVLFLENEPNIRWGLSHRSSLPKWAEWSLGVICFLGLGPLVTILAAYLNPFRTVLLMDSAKSVQVLPSQMSLWMLLLLVGGAGLFFTGFVRRKRMLWILVLGAVPALLLLRTPSIYLVPLFAVAFCAPFVASYVRWMRSVPLPAWGKELLLLAIFLGLCVPNVMASSLAQWRGRLVTDYERYDTLDRVNRFGPLMEEALDVMQQDPVLARRLFVEALQQRPLLLQYLLRENLHLSDLRWLTGGVPLRLWLDQVHANKTTAEAQSVSVALQQELSDAILCFFCLAFLEDQAGRPEASGTWLSQIQHLEKDPETLVRLVSRASVVDRDPALRAFVDRFHDRNYFFNPLPWHKDDYGFGRFLLRYFVGWDLSSSWGVRWPI